MSALIHLKSQLYSLDYIKKSHTSGCCVIVMRVNLKVLKENATNELQSAIIDFVTHCIVIHFGRKMSPESINVM